MCTLRFSPCGHIARDTHVTSVRANFPRSRVTYLSSLRGPQGGEKNSTSGDRAAAAFPVARSFNVDFQSPAPIITRGWATAQTPILEVRKRT